MDRTMTSQMCISLPLELHERLRELAWTERKRVSQLCREILELGLQTRDEQKPAGAAQGR